LQRRGDAFVFRFQREAMPLRVIQIQPPPERFDAEALM
jgi:hypothetical protein